MPSRNMEVSPFKVGRAFRRIMTSKLLLNHRLDMNAIQYISRTKTVEHRCKLDTLRTLERWVESSQVDLLKELLKWQDFTFREEETELRRRIAQEIRCRLAEAARVEGRRSDGAPQAGDDGLGRHEAPTGRGGVAAGAREPLAGLAAAVPGRRQDCTRSGADGTEGTISPLEQGTEQKRDGRAGGSHRAGDGRDADSCAKSAAPEPTPVGARGGPTRSGPPAVTGARDDHCGSGQQRGVTDSADEPLHASWTAGAGSDGDDYSGGDPELEGTLSVAAY